MPIREPIIDWDSLKFINWDDGREIGEITSINDAKIDYEYNELTESLWRSSKAFEDIVRRSLSSENDDEDFEPASKEELYEFLGIKE